jgi:hypothetical protein
MEHYKRECISGSATITALLIAGLCAASFAAETNQPAAASQFANQVAQEKYKQAKPPLAAPVFRWDFSKSNVVYTYAYEQQARSKTDMGGPSGGSSADMGQEMSAKGMLLVKSQGDGTANLVLKDMKISLNMDLGEEEPRTMEQQSPPLVVQGMKEDGSAPFGNSSQDMFLKVLFPLPPKALEVGESVDVPAQMPFNAMGSVLQVTGRSRITLTQYVTIGDRTCAQLDVDTDISHLDVPKELEGEYTCSSKGTSVFYFDVASRSFVLGTIAYIMQFSIDAPMPQMDIPGEDIPEMPERSKMSMVSDNLIRVKLEE